jgi:hypothetical protein
MWPPVRPKVFLQIERREHLPVLDERGDAGRVRFQRAQSDIGELGAARVPCALAQRERRVL